MHKCFGKICSLHAGQFSKITSPHFLFVGANDAIEQFKLFVAVHESESGASRHFMATQQFSRS
jgi:hypothetical protein